MLFLVDYENVGKAGMKGCDYLEPQDYVIIFYSEARKHMEQRILEQITDSGCVFEICKLHKAGKNALDFYIVSRLGELIGGGYHGTGVIVSNDAGFAAARDYWEKRALNKRKILLSPCVEDGIIKGGGNSERIKILQRLRDNLPIGEYYSAYSERMRIRETLRKLFEGTEYENQTGKIQGLLEGGERTARVVYLRSLHLFGRKSGLEIYHKIKESGELQTAEVKSTTPQQADGASNLQRS